MADMTQIAEMSVVLAKVLVPALILVVGLKFVAGLIVRNARPDTAPAAVDAFAADLKTRFVRMKWLLDGVGTEPGEARDAAIAGISGQMGEHTAYLVEKLPVIRQSLSPRARAVVETYLDTVDVLNRTDTDMDALIEGERRALMTVIEALAALSPRQLRR